MLRRTAGPALVGAGIFLVIPGLLLSTVVYPRLAVLPLDPQAAQTLHGTGFTVFVPRSAEDGGPRLYRDAGVTSEVRMEEDRTFGSRPSDSPNLSWRVTTSTSVDGVGPLADTVEGVSLDRRTALATNCCRDYLVTEPGDASGEPLEHEGYVLVFPFDVRKRSYPLWDRNLRGTADAVYVAEEERHGLRVYRFEQTVPDRKTGTQSLPGQVLGLQDPLVVADARYRTRRTYWVEPNSGAVVDYAETTDRRFVYEGRVLPVFQGTLRLQPGPGADRSFERARAAAVRLALVKRTLPRLFVTLGVLCLALGAVLVVRRRRRKAAGPLVVAEVRMAEKEPPGHALQRTEPPLPRRERTNA